MIDDLNLADRDFADYVIRLAIAEMTKWQAIVFVLHRFDVPLKTIAEVKGVSPQAIGDSWAGALAKVRRVSALALTEARA